MVGENDIKLADGIKAAYSLPCEVVLDRSVRLGGFIVRDDTDSVYFDESLGQKLNEQKVFFVEHNQLLR